MEATISGMGWVSPRSHGNGKQTVHHESNPGLLPKLSRKEVLDRPYKPFGRMDRFSKLGFAALTYALEDAGSAAETDNTAIIASTVFGCLDTDLAYHTTLVPGKEACASPALFAYTLPNSFLGEACIYYGFTGETFVINEGKTSGMEGLFMAMDLLESSVSTRVVCGICDLVPPDLVDLAPETIPGALFFVLDKKGKRAGYGTVQSMEKGNGVRYREGIYNDLAALGRACKREDE